jgi:hypothetical protein
MLMNYPIYSWVPHCQNTGGKCSVWHWGIDHAASCGSHRGAFYPQDSSYSHQCFFGHNIFLSKTDCKLLFVCFAHVFAYGSFIQVASLVAIWSNQNPCFVPSKSAVPLDIP